MMRRLILVLSPIVLLAACGDDESKQGDGRTAAGEVLEGSISDGMIPLDQLKSQAPLAEPEKAAATASDATDESESEPDADGAAQPASGDSVDPVAAAVEANTGQ
ncbi:hypothetical protein MB02_01450 [Croceicoccus estronivorus]|uniref:hypothetical protein n=1 Tax=Croceicoccus estronivorus TaxID=1172626 RepID=UPI00083116A5|nr:hypothetical protein [Croceicoccus estronivorus]OCC25361.1 hypothetical protein MB02_01450 [Croceicoccus estronivorus]